MSTETIIQIFTAAHNGIGAGSGDIPTQGIIPDGSGIKPDFALA